MSRQQAFRYSPPYRPMLLAMISAFLLILPRISLAGLGNADGEASGPRKIKPKVTRPSGPTNVKLFVVSRTELGVVWEPPIFDGGKSISKYLIEWDTDKSMSSVIASPENPYNNSVDGPLVRSEVVSSEERQYRIAGLDEGQKYYVRVSAYGNGYSPAISSEPQFAIPAGMLPGFLTRVSLAVASDSNTADRLRLSWSAPEFDTNGFGVLPAGCAGGILPPSAPDALTSYRVMWDTHPSLSSAFVYDVPAVSGDGFPLLCCPTESGDDGTCSIELGAEVQSIAIMYPQSTVPSGGNLFDTGAVRIAYVGSQSKSIQVDVPLHGSNEVRISPSETLPVNSPIATGDLIRIQKNVYLVASADDWPNFINISSGYIASNFDQSKVTQAYFTTPPQSCFDVSNLGNSADNFRAHLSQNFDDSPFDETITVSRSTVTKPYDYDDSEETRVVGYRYHVTFSGQGFSSTLGSPVEELFLVSSPDCGVPFVSNGVDVSSNVSFDVSTEMDSGSITPGRKYYVKVAGLNSNGAGPYVPSAPVAETPRSLPGLAQNCRVYAVPTASSSLRVEWGGVYPNHGQSPSSYRLDFYDLDGGVSLPVNSLVVNDINERTKYSVTKKGLVPGKKYKVNVVAVNQLGEGAPSWFSDFNPIGLIHDVTYTTPAPDYIQRSCNAVPTCDKGSMQCVEDGRQNFAIVARSVPPPPKIEVGTFPNVSSRNRFSKDSILVTFESPSNFNTANSIGISTDKFLVEWSTSSSFAPTAADGLISLWSSEVVAQYLDEDGEYAIGEFLLESLTTGTNYFVRVSAHNTAGYGAKADSIPVKPMTRPDPPFEPILSRVTTDHLETLNTNVDWSDSAIKGTSLLVIWQPPRIDSSNDRPDLVGDGGDEVSSYLVEWSRVPWDNYTPSVYEINLRTSSDSWGSDAIGLFSGSFQILIDASASVDTPSMGKYLSAAVSADESAANLKITLENVPNIGEVEVTSPEPFTWRITFLSEVGDFGMTIVENQIFDGMFAGIVSVTKVSAAIIPANSAYGFEVLNDVSDQIIDGCVHYFIRHLVPGMKIYVRVSSGNQVGFGPRRKTAPEYSSPALQRPDVPTSLYSDDVPPYLSVYSPTELAVHIGPPFYDGGSPLTTFFIEWDTSPTFDSSLLGDGSSLGSSRVDAASRVCTSCVHAFEAMTSTLTYAGSEETAKMLIPQRRIMIYFHDDNEAYLFSVLSASVSTITVSEQHLRMSSLDNMRGTDGSAGSNIDILGVTFIISGLSSGRSYHVRVSSENGEMGTGKSVATLPSKEVPRGFPLPPSIASVWVVDKNTLNVSWSSDAYVKDPNILAFKVESFRKDGKASESSLSFYGEQEVVKFSTSGLGIVGGTFKLHFGELGDSTSIFLSNASARNGLSYIETKNDLSPHLDRGESIIIGKNQYSVHDTKPFTSTILPLDDIFLEADESDTSIFARPKTMPIAFNAKAEEVRNALEQLPHVNHVDVRREIDDSFDDGYDWFVTFISNVGAQPAFSVDTSNLVGLNPTGFTIARIVPGLPPKDYNVTIIRDPTVTSYDVRNLSPGMPYYIRVSSVSDRGESLPVDSVPAKITPGGVPGIMPPPSIRPIDDTTLLVSFAASAENNGAIVEKYFVETSSNTIFSENSRIIVLPNHKFQRITTRAHTIPWDANSSFTLSLGDFRGDFTVVVGDGSTTVRVRNEHNVLERSSGRASLSAIPRGDFVSVGGVEFRVCLSGNYPHDDSHISLCSKENAIDATNFFSNSALTVVDELPIFILDTSLGASRLPTLGDTFLSTVDALSLSIDTRPRLRRGDMIRVGHPESGETFRVSTDPERAFTDRVIPLSSVDDANTPASLSSKSLNHATYEVQSFFIRSSSDAAVLTPSDILSSGYRIRFKSETTECLKWDGAEDDLKVELESMTGIDAVEITRDDLPPVVGSAGAGVKYFVTFTGSNVRGNVPPLQIVDVGSNGCLDAHLLGGKFGDDIAPIEVEQVEIPYVPFYDIQTTADIPYDASAADMKAALESLSQACTVSVSRKDNRHGYSWDVTFIENEGGSFSPLLALSANGANLSADIDPGVSVVDIQHVMVTRPYGGTPVFARIAAVNSFGTGPYTLSNPRAAEASAQPPSEPVGVFAEVISNTEIFVQWNPPLNNGGRAITHYKIEYDHVPSYTGGQNGGPYGSISLSSSFMGSISDVQSVTVKIDNSGQLEDEVHYLSGTFSLSFDGQKTSQLPYNASPEAVKTALEALCNVNKVTVRRSIHCSPEPSIGCMSPEGYTWLVMFASLYQHGDQHLRHNSKLATRFSHKLSVDGSYLFECGDVMRTACTIGGRAVASIGTVQEIQEVEIASSPFSVTIGGETSEVINTGDSLFEVERKLNSYSRNGIGKISVTCAGCTEDAVGSGDTLLLYFASYRGDLPLVVVSDPLVVVRELVKGSSQFVVGRASYSTVITGLSSVHDWYVRVFAYNGVGEGIPELAWPYPLRLSAVAPQAPTNIAVSVLGSTSLQIAWDRPSSIGAAELSAFVVQYDTSFAFATQNGMPLEEMTVLAAEVDASIAVVSQSFPNSNDPILRRRIIIDNVDSIFQFDIGPGSKLTIDDRQLTVSSINEDNCGVTCLTMDQDYVGSNASGVKVYLGLDPRHYRLSISDLIPGMAYFIRVAAVNEHAVGPFSFDSYPVIPVSSIPMDVPTVVSWAAVSSIASNSLRIDFAHPLDKPFGVNGSPTSKFHVELATGVDEVQKLRVSSTAKTNSSFSLVFDGEKTGCIAFGASAGTIEQALETLTMIDDVLVKSSALTSLLIEYDITFVGSSVTRRNQPLLEFASSSICVDNDIEINIFSVQDGIESFRPEVIALSTEAADTVSGFLQLSVGFQGVHDKVVSVNGRPAQFKVDPGSRVVSTMGEDLTSVLSPGETIVIGQEVMEVHAVRSNEILVNEYHIHGTAGAIVSGYRMNNYVGSAFISPGGNSLTDINGLSLESVLRSGEVIEVYTDDVGGKQYLTINSIAASTASFSPSFSGSITKTPVYARTSVILPASSSSALMQSAIESLLQTTGLVEVSREGPNSSEGFTWFITFHSSMGLSSCSLPSLCLAAQTEAVAYMSVNGLGRGYDGHYIQSGFTNGRPRFELLGKSCHVLYDYASSEWRLYNATGSIVSFAHSIDTSVPLSGWSNEVVVSLSSRKTPLLLGQNAIAQVAVLQPAVQQSFEDSALVYSEQVVAGKCEVQEIKILSNADDISGSFELSFGVIPQNVIVYTHESSEDFKTKLQSLSGVGRVSIESTNTTEQFGRSWLITFLSNSGDVPLLKHHGIADLLGSSLSLSIFEKVKGAHGQYHIKVDGLDQGNIYTARISAENEAGIGSSTSSQVLGVYRMAQSVSAPPGSPMLELGIVTKSRANVKFTEPPSNGSNIVSYKFEWTTSSSFDQLSRANVKVSCSDGSLVWGSLQFMYGKESASKKDTSVPIDIRSSAVDMLEVLSTLKLLNKVEVITVTNETSEMEWDIKYLNDAGPIGQLTLDAAKIQCESQGLPVDTTIITTVEGSVPSNYESKEIFTDYTLCGSVNLGEFSAVQYLSFTASSDVVTAGSYKLSLEGDASICIPVDASESQMKHALEMLEGVEEVVVTANAAPDRSRFPYEYKVSFSGNYPYGDWPALQVESFGDGECDSFIGGVDHRAIILPIRDESFCLKGANNTIAIVADSITSVGGTFDIFYGQESATDVSVNASASEMREILAQLISPDVKVSRHYHDDMGEGVAWAVTYPGYRPTIDHIRIVDTHVTGRNAKVDAYPIIVIETFSPENDSSGDFRIMIDGELTGPISYRASEAKILHEMHQLVGIGKVNMLGPANGHSLSPVNLSALVDDLLTYDGQKVIATVGDFTSTFAPGDKLKVGTCELEVNKVSYHDFDETESAGLLYHTNYPTSIETANARVHGFSVLQINHKLEELDFANDCSQPNGASVTVRVGSHLDTGNGVVHSMIVKAFTADLNDLGVLPEQNWRGTAPRIFFKHPFGIAPFTITLEGLEDKKEYIVRASARNSHGFGPPSPPLSISTASTVPGSPRAILLF